MRRILHSFEFWLVLIVLISQLYVFSVPANSLMRWYSSDDAFYYFKTAQNIAEGHGITFDQIGATNGFHPLWMVICVPIFALARLDLILPLRILACVSLLISALSGIFLYRLLKMFIPGSIAIFGALVWVLFPRIFSVTTMMGMESTISAMSIILLFYLVAKTNFSFRGSPIPFRSLLIISLAAIFVLFSRLDNIFLIVIVGIWLVIQPRRLNYVLMGDVLLAALSALFAYVIRMEIDHLQYQYSSFAYILLFLVIILTPLLFDVLKLYFQPLPFSTRTMVLRLLIGLSLTSILAAGGLFVADRLGLMNGFPRSALIFQWLLSTLSILSFRIIVHKRWLTSGLQNNQREIIKDLFSQWRLKLQAGLTYFLPIIAALIFYIIANWLYAGTPLPVSGQIKRWWGTLDSTIYGSPIDTLPSLFGLSPGANDGPWSLLISSATTFGEKIFSVFQITTLPGQVLIGLLVLTMAFLYLIYLFRKKWPEIESSILQLGLIPLFLACFLQFGFYKATGYLHTRVWYWIPEMIFLVLLGCILLDEILKSWKKIYQPKYLAIVAAIGSLALLINYSIYLSEKVPNTVNPEKSQAYLVDIQFLESMTPSGSLIGATGGGYWAYFIQGRTIVNLDGLISSTDYFEKMKQGKIDTYLDQIGLNYVFGNEYMLMNTNPYKAQIANRLKPIENFDNQILYRYLHP